MYELIVPLLTFISVTAIGGALLTARAGRVQRLQQRLLSIGPAAHQAQAGSNPQMLGMLARVGRVFSFGSTSATLKEDLAKAGYYSQSASSVYLGAKMILLVGGLITSSALLLPLGIPPMLKAMLVVLSGAVLSFVPNMVVQVRRGQRSQEVRHHLPDAVDLLEICVSAGMGIDMAWNSVAEEIHPVSPTLADEMALTNLEIHLGAARAVAMRHMAERTGSVELSSLVALMVQSERFGTSVAEALRTFAASMREGRSMRAEESAEKMSVRLLLPMVLFIFPAVITVMVGPAAIRLVTLLGGK